MRNRIMYTLSLMLLFLFSAPALAQTNLKCEEEKVITKDLAATCIPEGRAGATLAAAISYYQSTYLIVNVAKVICDPSNCNDPSTEFCTPRFVRWGLNSSPLSGSTVTHDTTNNLWCFPRITKNYVVACGPCTVPDIVTDTTTTDTTTTGGTTGTGPTIGGTTGGGDPGIGGTTGGGEPGTSGDTRPHHDDPPGIEVPFKNTGGQEGQLKLYPLPADQAIDVSIDLAAATANARWTIVDLSGRTHYSKKLGEIPKGTSTRNLSTAELAPGIYFLTLYDEGKPLSTAKMLINR